MYPTVYQEKLDELAEGKYGADRQELYKKTPYAAISAEYVVLVCGACGAWEESTDMTLYAPNDPDEIGKKQFGIKTAEEWGYVPYAFSNTLKKDYHVLKREYHTCSKCGKRMHKASSTELIGLPCPECGTVNQLEGIWCWD